MILFDFLLNCPDHGTGGRVKFTKNINFFAEHRFFWLDRSGCYANMKLNHHHLETKETFWFPLKWCEKGTFMFFENQKDSILSKSRKFKIEMTLEFLQFLLLVVSFPICNRVCHSTHKADSVWQPKPASSIVK